MNRNIAVIGCGWIFRAIYAPLLKQVEDRVGVAAVCDPNLEACGKAREFFPKAGVYGEAARMLERESPDAVMVLTTERFNAPVAMQVLQAGLPVYLEKPPASSLLQLEALMEKERAAGRPVYSAFNRRLTPVFREWRAPVGVRTVRGLLSRIGRRVDNFPYTAVHLIDAAQYFSGQLLRETEAVFAADRWQVRGIFEDGAECRLDIVPAGTVHEESLFFETEKGVWTLEFPNRDATRNPRGRMVFLETASGHEIDGRAGQERDGLKAMGFADTLEDFLGALETGTLQETPHRLARARPTIDLVEKMFEAGNFGRP